MHVVFALPYFDICRSNCSATVALGVACYTWHRFHRDCMASTDSSYAALRWTSVRSEDPNVVGDGYLSDRFWPRHRTVAVSSNRVDAVKHDITRLRTSVENFSGA